MKMPQELESWTSSDRVRKTRLGDVSLYAAVDLIASLSERGDPQEQWEDLKRWNANLAAGARKVQMLENGHWVELEMLTLEGAMLLAQGMESPAARKIRLWLAEAGAARLAEQENPELAIARTRHLYESRGYSREWVSKRLRGISARQELVGQWYARGASESEQFRNLTNTLMEGAFGMDVEHYKRHKNLRAENLRDHMNDLELALTVLGETTAAILHKRRDSVGYDELARDAKDAGAVTRAARQEIEAKLGGTVLSGENYVRPLFKRTRRGKAA